MSKNMRCSLVFHLILLTVTVVEMSSDFIGTRQVRWVSFENLKLTWNEASSFCNEEGGHLAVTDTHLTLSGLTQAVQQWMGNTITLDQFWIGLHTAEPNKVPQFWEEDCNVTTMDMWAPGEPNYLANDMCVRVTYRLDTDTSVLWKTSGCSDKHHVVCEFDKGECGFERHDNITLTLSPNVTHDVTTFNECTSLCLQLLENEEECVAFSVSHAYAWGMVCQIYLGSQLLNISEVLTSPMKLSSVNLRRCFQYEVRETPTQYSHTNSDKIPLPANGPCSIANATTSPAPSPYSTTSEIRNTAGTESQKITTTAVFTQASSVTTETQETTSSDWKNTTPGSMQVTASEFLQSTVITEKSPTTTETQDNTSSDWQNTTPGNKQVATSEFLQSTTITDKSPTTNERQGDTSIKQQNTNSWKKQEATTELVQITDSIDTSSIDTMTELQGNTPIENSTTSGYKPDYYWNFNTTKTQGDTARAVQGTTMGAPKSSTATTMTTTAPADATPQPPPPPTTTTTATTSTPKTTITTTVTAASTITQTPAQSTLVSAAATNMSASVTSTLAAKASTMPTSTSSSNDSTWKSSVTAGLKRCRCICVSKVNLQESPKTESSDVIHPNTTSQYRRKKVSTYDNTPSHACVSFSIIIVTFVLMFGYLVVPDTKKCFSDMKQNWCR